MHQGAEHPVHEDGVVAVVVVVCAVMDGMVAGAHDGPWAAMDAVMDVGGPYALHEEQHEMHLQLDGHHAYQQRMRHRLNQPVHRVERQPCIIIIIIIS
jgi:hypothetical protein